MKHAIDIVLANVIGLLLAILAGGCASRVTGGRAFHDDHAFDATLSTPYGPVTIHGSNAISATTQPSAYSNAGTPKLGAMKDDQGTTLSGVSFDAIKSKGAGSWALAAICLVAAGLVFYFLHDVVLAGGLAAVGVLSLLAPMLLSIIAVGVMVIAIIVKLGLFKGRIASGVQKVFDKLPEQADAIKGLMKQELAPADSKAVFKA